MLQVFDYQTKLVRTVTLDDELWFVAKDVLDALSISWKQNDSLTNIKSDWKTKYNTDTPNSGVVEIPIGTWLITEPAVYKIAFRSNKEEAEVFTDYVAEVILPTIRKTGKFVVDNRDDYLIQSINKLLASDKQRKQELNSLKENNKLLMERTIKLDQIEQATQNHVGIGSVIEHEINDYYPINLSYTAQEYLIEKKQDLSILPTLRKRASQFVRLGQYGEVCKNKRGQNVYQGQQIIYLQETLKSILDLY